MAIENVLAKKLAPKVLDRPLMQRGAKAIVKPAMIETADKLSLAATDGIPELLGKVQAAAKNFDGDVVQAMPGIMNGSDHAAGLQNLYTNLANKAVDTIDECLGRLRTAIEAAGGVMLLTADHGNIELMKDPVTGEPHTAHTIFDVPIVAINAPKGSQLENGRLADVAPTMLALMDIRQPAPMTGHSLIRKG